MITWLYVFPGLRGSIIYAVICMIFSEKIFSSGEVFYKKVFLFRSGGFFELFNLVLV
jgi:hypothetical protein